MTEARLLKRPSGRFHAWRLDMWSSLCVFFGATCTFDTLLSICMAEASLLLYTYFGVGLLMDFNLSIVSTGLVFPLTMSISQAFSRREVALRSVLQLRAWTASIFAAHRLFDWPSNGKLRGGRANLPYAHVAAVRSCLEAIHESVKAFCLLPRSGHARFVHTRSGVEECAELEGAINRHTLRIARASAQLFRLTEDMKAAGFGSSEASRVSQWVQKLLCEWELIRAMKEYRTPHAMRSFGRVYVIFLPVIIAPHIAATLLDGSTLSEAQDVHGAGVARVRICIACFFAAVVSSILAGLLSVVNSLENPFSPSSLDSVRVVHELNQATLALHVMDEITPSERKSIDQAWLRSNTTSPASIHSSRLRASARRVSACLSLRDLPKGHPVRDEPSAVSPPHDRRMSSPLGLHLFHRAA